MRAPTSAVRRAAPGGCGMTAAVEEWPAVMSKGEYGAYRRERFGRGSGPYISKLIGKGRLTAPALRPDGKVDREAADAQIAAASDPARVDQLPLGKMGGRQAGSLYQQVRTSREYYQALEAQTRYQRQAGQLVASADIAGATETLVSRCRDSLLRIPRRLASKVAAESDPFKVESIIREEVSEALSNLARGLAEMAERAQAEHDADRDGAEPFAYLFADERRSPVPEQKP